PRFESERGYRVRVQAVGSGMAMDLARKGNADVLLVHEPESERKLLDEGIGTDRRLVMHNDFVLAGPPNDPAGIRGLQSITEAFRKIAEAGSPFVSRGDASGTDKREKTIWKKAGLDPSAAKYSETKSGMAETLAAADGKKGYTLTDRATFLSQKHNLEIMAEGDDLLLNMYHVIRVNPGKISGVNAEGAERLAGFMVGSGAQQLIGDFMREGSGRLFIPDAGKSEQDVLRGWKQVLA
ncbi:MAG: substrate-binding domain-containing protein, partial [Firmicutes bacterium]|nr:substrate-binding domain-containing protein [Bacillota bacterium]